MHNQTPLFYKRSKPIRIPKLTREKRELAEHIENELLIDEQYEREKLEQIKKQDDLEKKISKTWRISHRAGGKTKKIRKHKRNTKRHIK